MACTITVTSAVLNASNGNLTLNGDILFTDGCAAFPAISVNVVCGSQSFSGKGGQQPGLPIWGAIIPVNCPCNSPMTITVQATCPGPPSTCTTTFTTSDLCCCPQISTQMTYGLCTNNNQLISFDTFIVNNSSCVFSVRRDFGNGSFGNIYSIAPNSSGPLQQEQSSFSAPASYISSVDVLSPLGCGSMDSVSFSAACAGCYSSTGIAVLCRFLEWLFLFSMTAEIGR